MRTFTTIETEIAIDLQVQTEVIGVGVQTIAIIMLTWVIVPKLVKFMAQHKGKIKKTQM